MPAQAQPVSTREEGQVLSQVGSAHAANAPPSAGLTKGVAEMDIGELVKVRVTPFDVSTRLDIGYRASNSVSASRFDAPIGDLPFAIQAFTGSFIKDQKPVNIFDVARYSPPTSDLTLRST
jgi:iron complex outermembrane receptor protein